MKPAVIVLAATAAAALCPPPVSAQYPLRLLSPVEAQATRSFPVRPDSLVEDATTGFVDFDRTALATVIRSFSTPPETISDERRRDADRYVYFDLPNNVLLRGVADWLSDGDPGSGTDPVRHLGGRLEGADAPGSFLLTIEPAGIRATLITPQGRFLVRPTSRGHAVSRVVTAPVVEPSSLPVFPDTSGLNLDAPPPEPVLQVASLTDPTVVTVMFVVTRRAESYMMEIDSPIFWNLLHHVALINHSFYLQRIPVRLRFVHWIRTNYAAEDPNIGLPLEDLTFGAWWTGPIDRARDRYSADLVHLVVHRPVRNLAVEGAAGVAWTPTRMDFGCTDTGCGFHPLLGYGVSLAYWLDRSEVLAHELGHNFGLQHDRWTILNVEEAQTFEPAVTSYAFGYVNRRAVQSPPPPRRDRWRTIMSYDHECTAAGLPWQDIPTGAQSDACYGLLHWSNRTNGNPRTINGPANAARAIAITAPYVATYR